MTRELVSVVIPTYNYGHFVCDAIDSALAQTYAPVEVIVVDDGSTDDTRERVGRYGGRVRYIHQPNQGLSAARNTGIRAARGSLIALLDSDDRWHVRRLEVQTAYLSAHPETGLVAAACRSDPDWSPVEEVDDQAARPVTMRELMIRSRFGPSGVLARRECFDTVGDFDVALKSAEDRDMWIRIASRYPVALLGAPLWWYRLHAASMSRAAIRMEDNEMRVLHRALAMDGARGDLLLRGKVLSYALKSAAYRYHAIGMSGTAVNRVVRSMLWWPFPYRTDERKTPMERPKMLVLNALRLARGWVRRPLDSMRGRFRLGAGPGPALATATEASALQTAP